MTVRRVLVDPLAFRIDLWEVSCDGCGIGLPLILGEDAAGKIGTCFNSAATVFQSARQLGWSIEPPDGRDGAYCPSCQETDAGA
jgi:hypothetical protein